MTRTISRAEVEALAIPLDDIARNVADAFCAGATGDIVWKPKTMLASEGGAFQMSTFAAWRRRDLSLFHMLVGPTSEAVEGGAPGYLSRQLVFERASGSPIALLDGTYTSNVLPVAIGRTLAKLLARPRTGVATIIGAGVQARMNLEALDGVLPIEEVRIITRTAKSAESFCEFIRQRGQKPVIVEVGPQALQGADIVISTIPASPGLKPFLDPEWVEPGTFVNVVDLGRSWKNSFSKFDRVIVDDRIQAEQQHKDGRLLHGGPFDSEIADVLTGTKPGRVAESERIVLIHPGNVVGVMGVTTAVLSAFRACGAV